MTKTKVLVDLKIALNYGYCGIATETRLVFKMLNQARNLDTHGLLISSNMDTVFARYKLTHSQFENIEQANQFFHEALHHESLIRSKILTALRLGSWYARKKQCFNLYPIDPIYRDAIWRNVFAQSLGASDKENIVNRPFYFSDLATKHITAASYFDRPIFLNTEGYDFAVFLEPCVVHVSPGTKKIVRFHDIIPISDPDFANQIYARRFITTLKQCAEDSYFVCNSEPTRTELLKLIPELESKTAVIPCAMVSNYQRVNNLATLKQILLARLSKTILAPENVAQIKNQISEDKDIQYIFNLATLDPKKNHVQLVKAWEKIFYQSNGQIKLIIGANLSPLAEAAIEIMRPHVNAGNIIHLDKVSYEELPYLYSHARAFVFPSYIEGFGLPPIEAIQCECPTIVSDIPAHRWVMGNAALYCDPYDSDDIAKQIQKVIADNEAAKITSELAREGLSQVKKYRAEVLQEQWAAFFDNMRTK